MTNNSEKLEQLAEDYGFNDSMELLEAYAIDSVCPGICKECGYSTEVEPDQTGGWCEECDKGSVISAMVLSGVI